MRVPTASTYCEPAGAAADHPACVVTAAGQRCSRAARAEDRASGGESLPYPQGLYRLGWEGTGLEVGDQNLLISFTRRPSWYGNLTLASARLCVCGCQKLVAPLLSPATISKRVLAVRRVAWRAGAGRQAGEGGPQRTASLPMSLRRLFGGLRAHVPRPGAAHLWILPYQVSLPQGTC